MYKSGGFQSQHDQSPLNILHSQCASLVQQHEVQTAQNFRMLHLQINRIEWTLASCHGVNSSNVCQIMLGLQAQGHAQVDEACSLLLQLVRLLLGDCHHHAHRLWVRPSEGQRRGAQRELETSTLPMYNLVPKSMGMLIPVRRQSCCCQDKQNQASVSTAMRKQEPLTF